MVELIGEDDENDTSKGNELRLSTRMSRASVVQSGLESLPSGKSIEPRIIGENSKARANILQSGKENEGVGRNNSMRGKKSRKAKNDPTKANKSILTRVDKVLTTQLTLPNIKNRSKSNSLKDMQTEKRLTDRAVNEVRLFHTDRINVETISSIRPEDDKSLTLQTSTVLNSTFAHNTSKAEVKTFCDNENEEIISTYIRL
eukprot:TRINITY_DN0_c1778_g1_i2.p2 TRINITY_DN0_c1778_g1~~TRINITY_DN0_c1778_g1_i2.p2  ORF type:complete len:201 (-),score=49.19 TRINITY_DN0_c1778_g1_i2:51-653(-)